MQILLGFHVEFAAETILLLVQGLYGSANNVKVILDTSIGFLGLD